MRNLLITLLGGVPRRRYEFQRNEAADSEAIAVRLHAENERLRKEVA